MGDSLFPGDTRLMGVEAEASDDSDVEGVLRPERMRALAFGGMMYDSDDSDGEAQSPRCVRVPSSDDEEEEEAVAMPDNQHALSSSWDKTVKLFNVNHGTVVRTFTHHTKVVRCMALLPDGLRFVSGSDDGTARIVEHGLAPQ